MCMPKMVLLVVRRETNAPWLTPALLVFVSREASLHQEPAVEVETGTLATRQTCVMEAVDAFQTLNLRTLLATQALLLQNAWSTNALLMEPVLKNLMRRMVLLVGQKVTSVPWRTLALPVFVSRELSLKLVPVVEAETAPLVTRLICVTEVEPASPTWSLKAHLAIQALM